MTLLLYVPVLFLLSGGSARVLQQGESFEQMCGQFFANGKPPTRFSGSQYKQICQTLNNVVHYATYYDTNNKIPVYSAYKFEGEKSWTRKNNWYIEPQLVDNNMNAPNMASNVSVANALGYHPYPSGDYDESVAIALGLHQALNRDYEKSGYDRGHLQPVFQANSQSCADATFTLTNAAPQNRSFNSGQWRVLEKNMAETLSDQCLPKRYSVYIVTGVTPGTKNLNNRVNVPSHFWTAYCCLDQNNKCQKSGGFIGENKNIAPEEITEVSKLETNLTELYKINNIHFKVFDSSTDPKSSRKSLREQESNSSNEQRKKARFSF